MKRWQLGAIVVILAIIILGSILAFQLQYNPNSEQPSEEPTSEPPSTEPTTEPPSFEPTTPDADLQQAIENAIDYFHGTNEPYALLMLDVMNRRFGITEFADALQRYDSVLMAMPDNAPILRVFRRIADYDTPVQPSDFQHVSAEVDLITVPALYCDQIQLSEKYPQLLENATENGEYQLTHVLLAWIWLQENDSELTLPEGFIEDVYTANAALINNDNIVNDLELEAASFLYLAGQGALVDDQFIDSVIASQNDDGGWSFYGDSGEGSEWHATISALLTLLHVQYPSDSYQPMLDPAS